MCAQSSLQYHTAMMTPTSCLSHSRPTNLAQQALTALARLVAAPRDPVAALASAVLLLALLAPEDAMPAYGASYASAVLLRQIMQQVRHRAPGESGGQGLTLTGV